MCIKGASNSASSIGTNNTFVSVLYFNFFLAMDTYRFEIDVNISHVKINKIKRLAKVLNALKRKLAVNMTIQFFFK